MNQDNLKKLNLVCNKSLISLVSRISFQKIFMVSCFIEEATMTTILTMCVALR